MSVVRMTEFQARSDTIDALGKFLTNLLPGMKLLEGYQGGMLIQKQDDPAKFTMVEYWSSVEAHQATTKRIPPEMIAALMPLLSGMPGGSYFEIVQKAGV